MSQHDMVVANADGATVRSDINSGLQALASTSKGNARPSTVYAGQLWLDDNTPGATEWTVYLYDGADDIPIGTFDTVANAFEVTIGAALALHADGWVFATDTDTGMRRSAADTIMFKAGGTDMVQISSLGVVVLASGAARAINTPRAAVTFQFPAGVPTVDRSFNVASLTDNGTGDVTVNLGDAVANAEVIMLAGAARLAASHSGWPMHTTRNLDRTQTTTALQLITMAQASAVDASRGSAAWIEGV